jgi:hypothetical protein
MKGKDNRLVAVPVYLLEYSYKCYHVKAKIGMDSIKTVQKLSFRNIYIIKEINLNVFLNVMFSLTLGIL